MRLPYPTRSYLLTHPQYLPYAFGFEKTFECLLSAFPIAPRRVIGIDISPVALRAAVERAQALGVADQVEFREMDVAAAEAVPEFDYAVGLGFIDYLDRDGLRRLFERLQGRVFLFSMFEKKLALMNLLHAVYVRLAHCPGAYKYTRSEMRALAGPDSGIRFLESDGLLFVTNLPVDAVPRETRDSSASGRKSH